MLYTEIKMKLKDLNILQQNSRYTSSGNGSGPSCGLDPGCSTAVHLQHYLPRLEISALLLGLNMINYSVELLSPGISPTRHYAAMKVFLARTPRHHPALVLPWCHGAGSSYVRCQSALTGPSQQPAARQPAAGQSCTWPH